MIQVVEDKIIQIMSSHWMVGEVLGLSERGRLYVLKQGMWEFKCGSPDVQIKGVESLT